MKLALGYRYFASSLGWQIERALAPLTDVTFVGLASHGRAGLSEAPTPDDLAQAAPDATHFVWIDPAGRYFPRGIEDSDALTACYLVDAHIGHWRETAARFFDVVFLAQKRYVEVYRRALGHEQVYWLPLAAGPDFVDHNQPRIYDVGFVGNVDRAHAQTPRARRLAAIAARFTLNPQTAGMQPEQVARVYSQSKIVLNTSIAGDATMRLFEGTACGALLLTDAIAPENGAAELFRAGEEIVVFNDDADMLKQIERLLADDATRARIAHAGQIRTRAEHLIGQRARLLLKTLTQPGLTRAAPLRKATPAERRAARLRVFTHLHMLDAIFDETRGLHPLQRAWLALPCLVRRVAL
jgi:hypothetical protein